MSKGDSHKFIVMRQHEAKVITEKSEGKNNKTEKNFRELNSLYASLN